METLFGTEGNCELFYSSGYKETLQAPKFLKELGLSAFEYPFGKGYTMKSEMARAIGKTFENEGISLSLHAPFFINFANPSEEMYEKTKGYIRTGIRFLNLMGAKRMVFHSASQGKLSRLEAINLTAKRFEELFLPMEEQLVNDGIYLCPETMGKDAQIGTYSEIIDLCTISKCLMPTFDFGHINCILHGGLNKEMYNRIFDYCEEKLGHERTQKCHVHFSKIQFGAKGEIRHLNFDQSEFGPEFEILADVLVERNLHPHIICESAGHQAQDALEMRNIYLERHNNFKM